MKPLAIDLFCGLGGWTDGLLAEGYDVIGFDIEQHVYGDHRYPAQLVLQDVLTLDGAQFRDADLIVASPPCQEYSYMAMPWSRAKQIAAALRGEGAFPEGYKGSRTPAELTALFDACFRIQREASEAAGRHIPLIVENVKGAQPWVGRARWAFGSFFLWGDVPALMPIQKYHQRQKVNAGEQWNINRPNFTDTLGWDDGIKVPTMGAGWYPPGHPKHVPGLGFNTHADRHTKNNGGSWFNIAHNTTSGKGNNPDGRKVPSEEGRRTDPGKAARFTSRDCGDEGIKHGGDWFAEARKCGGGGTMASFGSKSPARKFASAMIAKIPEPLSRHIAATFKPMRAVA